MVGVLRSLLPGIGSALLLLTACSKPVELGATPPTDPVPVPAATAPASPVEEPTASPLEQIRTKVAELKNYKVTITSTDHPEGSTLLVLMADGKPVKTRASSTMPGVPAGWMQMDLGSRMAYMYIQKDNVVIKTAMNPDEAAKAGGTQPAVVFVGLQTVLDQGPDVTEETLDGVDCWKVTAPTGQASWTCWIDQEYGLPRQYEREGKVTKMAYDLINTLPASKFELPANAKVVEGKGKVTRLVAP